MRATTPRWRAGLRYLTGLLALPFGPWILSPGRRWRPAAADCIIVPGAAVFRDGSPSGFLRARVANAVAMYAEGLSPNIVFTGGPRQDGPAEAEVAHALALEAGLPAASLHLESESRNTLENLLFARELMASHGWKSCLISTDPAHMRRCLWIARDLGLRAHPAPALASPSFTNKRVRRWFVARECRALLRYSLGRARAGDGTRR